ncbi:MAG: AMP-binding protein [Bacteroidota bacterium]
MTIPDPVRQWAETTPDALALVTDDAKWAWADLDARVGRCAAALAQGPERVAVRAPTSPDLVVLVLAALRAGRLLVPLSTRWTDADVVAALNRLNLDSLLSDHAVDGANTVPLASVTDDADGSQAAPADLELETWFTVVHTSGSTGVPKAVVHSVGNHVWSARGVIEGLGLDAGDRWLLDLPLYHVGGLGIVMRCVTAGATIALPTESSLPEAVAALRPTHVSLVSTQLRRLLDQGTDLSMLKVALLGGSGIPPDLLASASRANVPAVVSYGLTEMTSTVTATPAGAFTGGGTTSGRALPYREIRISLDREIEVGGPTLAVGVLADGVVEPLGPWHPTGDLGFLDEQSRLTVTGRQDLQFISGGENVYPETIEAALRSLDAVVDAVVVPIPDAEFGFVPAAFVESADILDARSVEDFLRQRIPGFMIPRMYLPWEGPGGMKPDRRRLADQAARHTRDAG